MECHTWQALNWSLSIGAVTRQLLRQRASFSSLACSRKLPSSALLGGCHRCGSENLLAGKGPASPHRPLDGVVLHTHELFLTCQEKTLLATELFGQRGEHWTFKFLAYVGCLLTYVASMGIVAKDTGATNLGVKLETTSAANPQALFFDTLSWTLVKPPAKPSCKWSGWFECAKSWCPFHARWLREAASNASSNPSGTFRRLFSECQSYEDVLVAQGIMADGEMVLATLPKT